MTLILAALILAAAVLGLVRVVLHLAAVRRTLRDVVAGVQVVAARTSTVPEALTSVNASLKPVRDFCENV